MTRERLVESVLTEVEHDQGGVVLLHDGGGDRSATVDALEPIITLLRDRGYRFVRAGDALGQRPLDAVNPKTEPDVAAQIVCGGGTYLLRALGWLAPIGLGH